MIQEWKSLSNSNQRMIRAHQRAAPISLGRLANELGLIVKAATLAPGISGEIRPDEGSASGFMIRVNRHESKERQRFTVAHELAHFLLHKDEIGAGVRDNTMYRSNLSNLREQQANRLAAEILMPWHLIEELLEDGRKTAAELAKKFQVSETAMNIRLGIPV